MDDRNRVAGPNGERLRSRATGKVGAGSEVPLTPPGLPKVSLPPATLFDLAAIDADHQHLIAVLEQIGSGANAEGDPIGLRLSELADHVGDHFLREEQIMRASRFPDFELHCEQHRAMIDLLGRLIHDYETGGWTVTPLALDLLGFSFRTHLHEADRRLIRFLESHHLIVPVIAGSRTVTVSRA